MTYSIAPAPDADAAFTPIWQPLLRFNEATVGDAAGVSYALTIKAEGSDEVSGGLWAMAVWRSFYIGLVVAPQDARGQGLGSELMRRAEAEAIRLGCREMWLDTYAFQARPFYERLGFSLFGQLDGPAPMFPRYFLRKDLPSRPPAG